MYWLLCKLGLSSNRQLVSSCIWKDAYNVWVFKNHLNNKGCGNAELLTMLMWDIFPTNVLHNQNRACVLLMIFFNLHFKWNVVGAYGKSERIYRNKKAVISWKLVQTNWFLTHIQCSITLDIFILPSNWRVYNFFAVSNKIR